MLLVFTALTLSNPAPWQNWMAACLGYTLRMKTLFRGWPVMVDDTYEKKKKTAHLEMIRQMPLPATVQQPLPCR